VIQGSEGPAESPFSEVEHFLSPTPDVEGSPRATSSTDRRPLQRREGPRPADRRGKDQVTVELYEATVPIPVTVRGDQIRVLDSDER